MYTADELEIRAALAGSPRADELIACLEGEIAKRDETIARLEPQLNRAIQTNYDLREELAACRVAVENCEVFRARIAELEDDLKCAHSMLAEVSKAGMALRAELAALKAQEPVAWPEGGSDAVEGAALGAFDSLGQPEHDLESWCAGYAEAVYAHAAPVSEAKAQGVVMPPPPYMPEVEPAQLTDYERGEAQGRCDMWAEVARLNAAPVQQVSVPDGWRELAKRADDFLYSLPETDGVLRLRADLCSMLAAPAAPAADAGLVEAIDWLDDFVARCNGDDRGSCDSVNVIRAALASRRAKGVV